MGVALNILQALRSSNYNLLFQIQGPATFKSGQLPALARRPTMQPAEVVGHVQRTRIKN